MIERLNALKQALVSLQLSPHQVLLVSDAQETGKEPHSIGANIFLCASGQAVPFACGVETANKGLTVIVETDCRGACSKDFLNAANRNHNITVLVHQDKQEALDPVSAAITARAGFVARGCASRTDQLADLIAQGIKHNGFSLIEIIHAESDHPISDLPEDYDPTNWGKAEEISRQKATIHIGTIYLNEDKRIIKDDSLVGQEVDRSALMNIINTYG